MFSLSNAFSAFGLPLFDAFTFVAVALEDTFVASTAVAATAVAATAVAATAVAATAVAVAAATAATAATVTAAVATSENEDDEDDEDDDAVWPPPRVRVVRVTGTLSDSGARGAFRFRVGSPTGICGVLFMTMVLRGMKVATPCHSRTLLVVVFRRSPEVLQ